MAAEAGALARAAKVRFLLLDVDGVLTDGKLYLDAQGNESRAFYVRDGLGIRVGQLAGLSFGILSGRDSPLVARRAEELGITEVHQGVYNKLERFEGILARLELTTEEVCFIGDDLIDLPVMRQAGFAVAPADADEQALRVAHYVTGRDGGRGAVREVIDLVLRASGRWDDAVARWTG